MDKNKIKNVTFEKLNQLFPNQTIITKNDIDIIFNNIQVLDKSSISKILNVFISKIKSNYSIKTQNHDDSLEALMTYASDIPKIDILENIDDKKKKNENYNKQLQNSNKKLNEYNKQLNENITKDEDEGDGDKYMYNPDKYKINKPEKFETKYIILDSKDRDLDEFPESNRYSIYFDDDTKGKKGFIKGKLINIKSIELIECIIINDFPDNNVPYILVNIEEIFGKSMGTNSVLSKSFCKLSSYTISKDYRYYNFKNTNYNPKITFDINKSFEKFTVSFLSPEGDLIKFDENKATINSLTFKIEIEKFNLQDKFPDYS